MMLLEKGRVPSFIVTQALTQHLSENDRNTLAAIDVLAEKASIPYETLETWYVNPERGRSVDFNAADRLLAAAGLWHWWYNRFRDYYEHVNLNMTKCGCPGCEVMIEQSKHPLCRIEGCTEVGKTRGLCNRHELQARRDGTIHYYEPVGRKDGIDKQYCSKACRTAAAKIREGVTKRRRKNYLNTGDKCRNGHDRTPENTYHRRNGKEECIICRREANKASYHARTARRREAVAA
jgi:hypothetical protein